VRFSTSDVYALHALAYLGTRAAGCWVRSDDIAEASGVPRPYLLRLLARLGEAGLVVTKRGAGGGYALARPPAEIDLCSVMRAVDGPVAPLACVSLNYHRPCPMEGCCRVRERLHERLRDAVLGALAQVSVADLAADHAAGVDYRHCLTHLLAPR
jgi:Rrf2 family transcriptional regulator, cysteine metabolism repressor